MDDDRMMATKWWQQKWWHDTLTGDLSTELEWQLTNKKKNSAYICDNPCTILNNCIEYVK